MYIPTHIYLQKPFVEKEAMNLKAGGKRICEGLEGAMGREK